MRNILVLWYAVKDWRPRIASGPILTPRAVRAAVTVAHHHAGERRRQPTVIRLPRPHQIVATGLATRARVGLLGRPITPFAE